MKYCLEQAHENTCFVSKVSWKEKRKKLKSCKSADKMYLQFEVVPALKW